MPKKAAILQSNYIPWKGYFDLINCVDEFILYDDVQFTKNDWRNRNIIKTPHGPKWLTIPVRQERLGQLIRETRINDKRWPRKHWATLAQNYSKAVYFREYGDIFERLYGSMDQEFLSDVNHVFIMAISNILGIKTRIRWSGEFELVGGRTERLVDLCLKVGATEYITGLAARNYLNEAAFSEAGIVVHWADYGGYPPYTQLYGEFEHRVSILDLLFNAGPDASRYMKSFGN